MFDLVRLAVLAGHSRSAMAEENLFVRKQLELFQERKVKPRRADDSTRWMMVTLSCMFHWRGALVNVKPDRQSETERRSRAEGRFHPHSAAMPLDGPLAECESKSIPGVFFAVLALRDAEYSRLECGVDTWTIVLHREYPLAIFSSG